jgi:hypothetical protein
MLIRGYHFVTIALLPSRCRIVTPRLITPINTPRHNQTLGPRGSDKGPLSACGRRRDGRARGAPTRSVHAKEISRSRAIMARARALGLPVGRPRDLHTPAIRDGLSALKRMGMPMYLPKDAPRNRIREATSALENRLEIVRGPVHGSGDAAGAFQMGPVHVQRLAGLEEWPQRLCAERLWPGPDRHPPQPAVWCPQVHPAVAPVGNPAAAGAHTRRQRRCLFPAASNEPRAKRLSYHNDFSAWKAANPGQPTSANPFCNPITTPCGLSASYAAGARDCARRLRVRPLVYATAEGASVPAFARCLPGRRWRFSRRRDANH